VKISKSILSAAFGNFFGSISYRTSSLTLLSSNELLYGHSASFICAVNHFSHSLTKKVHVMKSIISRTLALLAICTTLFSFSPKPGAEGFEIYLDSKLLVQSYGSDMNTVQSLECNQSAANSRFIIKYYHCGKIGKNRIITIKDAQNKVLKEFNFRDAKTPTGVIALDVKDVRNLKNGSSPLKLFYSSSELQGGRLLASVVI